MCKGAHHKAQGRPAVWEQDRGVAQGGVVQVVARRVLRRVPDALARGQQPEVVAVQVERVHLGGAAAGGCCWPSAHALADSYSNQFKSETRVHKELPPGDCAGDWGALVILT